MCRTSVALALASLALAGAAASPGTRAEVVAKIERGEVSKKDLEVVLAHFDEDVSWSDAYRSVRTVYCKGADGCPEDSDYLPNVGREGHTFLHHIVTNYDRLASWTVFSQAGAPTEGYSGRYGGGGGHMLTGAAFSDYLAQPEDADAIFLMTSKIRLSTLDHSLRSSFKVNADQREPPHSSRMGTCPVAAEVGDDTWGPYTDMHWLRNFIGERCGIPQESLPDAMRTFWGDFVQLPWPTGGIVHYAQGARFAASRERIRQRPKAFYWKLLQAASVEEDPCMNYLYEWVWYYIIGMPAASPCEVNSEETNAMWNAEPSASRHFSGGAGAPHRSLCGGVSNLPCDGVSGGTSSGGVSGGGSSGDSGDNVSSVDNISGNVSGGVNYSAPPEVEFIGKAPKLRIYPGGKVDESSPWMMLTFGKIQELDPRLKAVQGRSIQSLAARQDINWTQEHRIVSGVPALVTRMELPLTYGGSFSETCRGAGGKTDDKGGPQPKDDTGTGGKTDGKGGPQPKDDTSAGDNLDGAGGPPPRNDTKSDNDTGGTGGPRDDDSGGNAGGGGKKGGNGKGDNRRLAEEGSVAVEIIVFEEDAEVPYGHEVVFIKKGQLKFNIESTLWPFCDVQNTLQFQLDLKLPNDDKPDHDLDKERSFARRPDDSKDGKDGGGSDGKDGGKKHKGGKRFSARAGSKSDVVMELPEIAISDGEPVNASIAMDAKGSKTTILFNFVAFNSTLFYDPTVGFEAPAAELLASEECTICVDPTPDNESDADNAGETDPTPDNESDAGNAGETVQTKEKTVVTGSFSLILGSGMSAAQFCGNERVIVALIATLAKTTGLPADDINVTCSSASGRRLSGRRLGDAVDIVYELTTHEDTSSAGGSSLSAVAVTAAIESQDATSMTKLVVAELGQAGITVTVTVTSVSMPETKTITVTITAEPSTTTRNVHSDAQRPCTLGSLLFSASFFVGHLVF